MRYSLTVIFFFYTFCCIAQAPVDSAVTSKTDVHLSSNSKKKIPWNWIIPGTLVGLGVLGNYNNNIIDRNEIKEERYEHLSAFHKHADDYAPYIPAATVYFLNLIGQKPKHDVVNYSVILLKSELIMVAVTTPLKKITHVLRPDSSAYNSFPSGHTAQAFLAANFLRHEYGYKSVWYSIAGYALATGVGVFRVANNRHWISDVLAGAGIGILSSELAYATHQYRWNKKKKISIMPTFNGTEGGIYMVWKL